MKMIEEAALRPRTLILRAHAANAQGRYAEAQTHLIRALALCLTFRGSETGRESVEIRYLLALVRQYQGDTAGARQILDHAIEAAYQRERPDLVTSGLVHSTNLSLDEGAYAQAVTLLCQLLPQRTTNPLLTSALLGLSALALGHAHQYREALRLYGAMLATRDRIGAPVTLPALVARFSRFQDSAEQHLGKAVSIRVCALGKQLRLRHATTHAIRLLNGLARDGDISFTECKGAGRWRRSGRCGLRRERGYEATSKIDGRRLRSPAPKAHIGSGRKPDGAGI